MVKRRQEQGSTLLYIAQLPVRITLILMTCCSDEIFAKNRSFRLHDLSNVDVVNQLLIITQLRDFSLLNGSTGSCQSHHILLHTIRELQQLGYDNEETIALLS